MCKALLGLTALCVCSAFCNRTLTDRGCKLDCVGNVIYLSWYVTMSVISKILFNDNSKDP